MIEALLLLIALPPCIATATLAIELTLGARPARRKPREPAAEWTTAVLIPAHDEEHAIAGTLSTIMQPDLAQYRVLVVADNCSDATAAIARALGAEVVERQDADRRGKGHALAFGRTYLSAAPPQCVVVLDADTVPAPGALLQLVRAAMEGARPVQAAYFMTAPESGSPLARFSAIAFYVKNVVRQLGLSRLGAPAILTGSGMAFPWPVFAALPLDTGHVTEDLMLGVHCSLTGFPPQFQPLAIISGEASSDNGTGIQRRRWESGFFDTAREYVPQLVRSAITRRDDRLLWLAMHLATPPLLLLLGVDLALATTLGALALLIGPTVALAAICCVTLCLLVALVTAAMMHGQRVPLRDFMAIPSYLIWKVSLSVRALVRRERNWIRTSRK